MGINLLVAASVHITYTRSGLDGCENGEVLETHITVLAPFKGNYSIATKEKGARPIVLVDARKVDKRKRDKKKIL